MKEYLVNQLLNCGNKALKSTCQIFYKAKAIGSGVLITINDKKYLLSAAHVLEHQFVPEMTIPNGEILVEIQGELLTSQIPLDGDREDDKFDIGILLLKKECSDELEKRFRFITIDEIDRNHKALKSHQYMFCGYPVQDTIVLNMEIKIYPTPLKVRTKLTERQLVNLPKYSKNSKWILDYKRTTQKNIVSDEDQTGSHPKGVSGAGLWSIPLNFNLNPNQTKMKLIGIMTDFFEGNDQVVCATNINIIIKIIESQFIQSK